MVIYFYCSPCRSERPVWMASGVGPGGTHTVIQAGAQPMVGVLPSPTIPGAVPTLVPASSAAATHLQHQQPNSNVSRLFHRYYVQLSNSVQGLIYMYIWYLITRWPGASITACLANGHWQRFLLNCVWYTCILKMQNFQSLANNKFLIPSGPRFSSLHRIFGQFCLNGTSWPGLVRDLD